jgi:hypothetical protein
MSEVNQAANQTARMASTGQQGLSGMDFTMHTLAETTEPIGSQSQEPAEMTRLSLTSTALPGRRTQLG